MNGGGCGVSLVVKMFEIPKFRIRLVQLAVPVYDNNTYYYGMRQDARRAVLHMHMRLPTLLLIGLLDCRALADRSDSHPVLAREPSTSGHILKEGRHAGAEDATKKAMQACTTIAHDMLRHEVNFNGIVGELFVTGNMPNGGIIDAGGHTGENACYYAQLAPERHVLTVDPVSSNIAAIDSRGLPNVRSLHGGLGKAEGSVLVRTADIDMHVKQGGQIEFKDQAAREHGKKHGASADPRVTHLPVVRHPPRCRREHVTGHYCCHWRALAPSYRCC